MIKYPTGDCGFLSQVKQSQRTNPHSLLLDKISKIGNLEYSIGDIILNWGFSSVSPLFVILCYSIRGSLNGSGFNVTLRL